MHLTPILLEDLGTKYPKPDSKERKRYGLYQCPYCDTIFETRIRSVKDGHTVSCGCIKNSKQGNTVNKFYGTWRQMWQRCTNETHSNYKYYGARGISVCKEWGDLGCFIQWVDSTYIEGYTLDRIDVNGNYEPSNCRWADASTQARNTRKKITNTSGATGVSYHIRLNKYGAYISHNNKRKHLGYFINLEDAIDARDIYIKENNLSYKLSTEY